MSHEQLMARFDAWGIVKRADYPDDASFKAACIEAHKKILEEDAKINKSSDEYKEELRRLLSTPVENDGINVIFKNKQGKLFLKSFNQGNEEENLKEVLGYLNKIKHRSNPEGLTYITSIPSTYYQQDEIARFLKV